ncbi:MAG: hypothetical protein GY953_04240, partial [bacterium]|nr:hypothetical protein [bacterium]
MVHRVVERFNRFEHWTVTNSEGIAIFAVVVGLALRFWVASRSYLNPDEVYHVYLSEAGSFAELLSKALGDTHPPLLHVILHYAKYISLSEVWLRALPVLAGGLTPWIIYRWMKPRWGRAAALFALLILSLSPMLIGLSAQLRGYTLAMLFMALAIYALDVAIERGSAFWMAAFGLTLAAGILAEYVTAWFAVAAGFYFLFRFRETRLRWPARTTWVATQWAGSGIFVWLDIPQIQPLRLGIDSS